MRQGPKFSPMNRLPTAAAERGEKDYLLHVVVRLEAYGCVTLEVLLTMPGVKDLKSSLAATQPP